jgi:hypothetical protein
MTVFRPWPPPGVVQRRGDLLSVQKTLRTFDFAADLFAEQCMARYLTVRSAGYLEAVRDDVSDEFCAVRSPLEVVNRVRHHLRIGLGVTPQQLITFVGSFRAEWSTELELFLSEDDNLRKNRLGALVAARKKIAHGDGESVTTRKALSWAETADEIGDWLIKRFDPSRSVASGI